MNLENLSRESDCDDPYEPTWTARLNYLEYLLEEPEMDRALEALAALEETQRRMLVDFLRRLRPDESLDVAREGAALIRTKAN